MTPLQLAKEHPAESAPWVELLRDAVEIARSPEFRADAESRRLGEQPFAFVGLLVPFLRAGRRVFAQAVGNPRDVLSPSADADLDATALERMVGIAAPCFYEAFDEARRMTGGGYAEFVTANLDDGYADLFGRWPVLARLLATAALQWAAAAAEFVLRYRADRARLAFGLLEAADVFRPIARLRGSLSDPHHDGRSVFAVTFASGRRLYYKPRSLALEAGFFGLLRWINKRADSELRTLRVLDCTSHGWMEEATHAPAADLAAADRYYVRAGMLLCLVHVLRGTDIHHENVIAMGEHPVLIDLEMLANHESREKPAEADGEALVRAEPMMRNSVLRTGMLPCVVEGGDPLAAAAAGLGSALVEGPTIEVFGLTAVNQDDMRREKRSITADIQSHRVAVAGQPRDVGDHLPALLRGFRSMHRLLRDHRTDLLAEDGPLRGLHRLSVRIVVRPTRVYGALILDSLEPEWLRSGGLRRAFLTKSLERKRPLGDADATARLLEAEREALERLDVPYFTADSQGTALEVPDGSRLEAWFEMGSDDWVAATIRDLDPRDEQFQTDVIQAAIVSGWTPRADSSADEDDVEAGELPLLGTDDFVVEATRIGDELAARAIRGGDGTVTWLTLAFEPGMGCFTPQLTGSHLYDGAGGVALLFASLARTTGQQRFRALALDALGSLRVGIKRVEDEEDVPVDEPLGAGDGLGSLVYVLVATHELLGDENLLRDAQRVARLFTRERFAADRSFDLHAGAAGAAMALLALHGAEVRAGETGRDTLAKAIDAGQHLLDRRIVAATGQRTWRTIGQTLTGMSHGAAGIALALQRLAAATGRVEFAEAAREAIAFERAVFDSEEGNWPDFRSGTRRFMTTWCHGAPGIGLARIAGLRHVDDAATRAEIEVAARTTLAAAPCECDHLCCGVLGRAALLSAAAPVLDRPELDVAARRLASGVVHRARASEGYRLFDENTRGICIPGAFQGLAGIGLQLLRFAGAPSPEILTFAPASEERTMS